MERGRGAVCAGHGDAKEGTRTRYPDTLTSMCNLAATLYSQEQWKEAEEQFVQVVEMSSTVWANNIHLL
jgi:hypothetical protein